MAARKAPPIVLAIGGWDPTGGAGITADTKAIHALGAYAVTAVTGLAVQTPAKVLFVQPVDVAMLQKTLDDVFGRVPLGAAIGAVKTGMLASPLLAEVVMNDVRRRKVAWVFDPVRAASDGTALGTASMSAVFPRAPLSVVTPNRAEFQALTQHGAGTEKERKAGCAILFSTGFAAVLLKGGHALGSKARDELRLADGRVYVHERRRVAGSLHGSGCTLAAALAARLAAGDSLVAAFRRAERYMDRVFLTAWAADHDRLLSGRRLR